MFRRLAVVGVGLLGGSVAKAARAQGLAREIVGVGRDGARLQPALADGTLDRATTDVAAGVRDADLVVLAAPVRTIEELLPHVWRAAAEDALVTDVGSTKRAIVSVAQRLALGRAVAFVGSHPMAGSEQSGFAVARADLFQGATVIVTPAETSPPAAIKTVTAFWEGAGAGRVLTLDADAHDRAVAAISHVPHLVAFALMDGVARFDAAALDVAARGFLDTTRIAASDPVVWEEIFLANRDAIGTGLRTFERALGDLARLVEAADAPALRAALARIKAEREGLA